MEDDRGMTFPLPGLQQTEGRVARVEIRVADDPGAFSRIAASEILSRATASIAERGRFCLCLSGGSTPQSLYGMLAKDSFFRTHIPWDRIDLFWGDERHLPPDHPDSNYRMAKETLLSKVPIPEDNIHRIKGENPDPHQAAREYEEVLLHFFQLGRGTFPRFDLVLLGMGKDGHTASLFPGTEALQEQRRLVVVNRVEGLGADRITLTLPVLNQAAFLLFLVSGDEKAETLKTVLEDKCYPNALPVQLIHPKEGRVVWLVDKAAARLLRKGRR